MRRVSRQVRREIESTLSDPQTAAANTTYTLFAAADYTNRVRELEVSTEDGPGVVLDADIAGKLPASLEGRDVEATLYVGNATLTLFRGEAARPSDDGLLAGTGGYWLESISLGEEVSYSGTDPSLAAYELLSRAPYSGPVWVAPMDGSFTRSGEDAFGPRVNVSEALSEIAEEFDMSFFDTADNGHNGIKKPSLDSPGEVVWTFTVGFDVPGDEGEQEGGFSYAREEDSYRYVIVYAEQDGHTELTEPIEVPNSRAPAGAIYWLEQSVEENADGTAGSPDIKRAYQDGYERANRLSRGQWTVGINPVYIHPLLERGDCVAVIESGYERDGQEVYSYERRWVCVLTGHKAKLPATRGEYSADAEIVSEEYTLLESPEPVSEPSTAKPLVAMNWRGMPYFFSSLGWVWLEGNYVSLDPDAALSEGIAITEDAGTITIGAA